MATDKKMRAAELINALRPLRLFRESLQGLDDVLSHAASVDNAVGEAEQKLAGLRTEIAKAEADVKEQTKRVDEAKKATDDIVSTCKALADKAKAEKVAEEKKFADYMHEAQSAQGKKQVELNKGLEKYLAEMEAAKAASRQVYEADKAKLAAEYESLVSRKGQLQKEVDDLKKKLGTIFNS